MSFPVRGWAASVGKWSDCIESSPRGGPTKQRSAVNLELFTEFSWHENFEVCFSPLQPTTRGRQNGFKLNL